MPDQTPATPGRRDSVVSVVSVYPRLLGTYGDAGNARVVTQRLRWRGIAAELVMVPPGEPVPAAGDIYLLGGGEDAAQVTACRYAAQGGLTKAVARGAVVFGVCAGFQLLGTEFAVGPDEVSPGLGLLDVTTDRLPGPRAVGEIVTECLLPGCGDALLTGFENHQGRTHLGADARPLGRVRTGIGNGIGNGTGNGTGWVDGAVSGRVVGTYLHGPVLARNAGLADLLLSWVVGPLTALDDAPVEHLHRVRLQAAS